MAARTARTQYPTPGMPPRMAGFRFFSMPADASAGGPAAAPADPAEPGEPSSAADPADPGAEALGDAGKKALDAMKAKWKEAERVAKERDVELADLRAKAEGREVEHAAEQERRKVEANALSKANERILKAEVRAAAAGKLADPADALLYLNLSGFEVGDDGEVDGAAIAAAIEALASTKPYLAAQGGGATTVFESPGAHRNGAPARQVSTQELEGMTPDQINAARAEGRLNDLLGIKP